MKWFTEKEISGLDPQLVEMLEQARENAGVPFIITEGLIEKDHPGSHVNNTAHSRGKAVDLACYESGPRFNMINALLSAGFKRIGVYDRHIHADNDSTLPQNVMWWGKSH